MAIAYLVCAAGAGTRTQIINSKVPKPLLLLHGKTLLEHSLSSLQLASDDLILIIGQKKDALSRSQEQICSHLNISKNQIRWIDLDFLTRGQLDTALIGAMKVPLNYSLAVFNCDSYFMSSEVTAFLRDANWEGLIPCSAEAGDSWSFCRVDEGSDSILKTLEVAEKNRISNWCSVGFYFFRNIELFRQQANEEIQKSTEAEHFVAPLYNRYIENHLPVGTIPIKSFKAMGSVAQIQSYWNISLEEIQLQNLENPFAAK